MSRIPILTFEALDADQRRVYDAIKAGRRGAVLDLFMTLLHSPTLADHMQKLGVFLRYETSLPPRLSELAILTTAREWSCQYEWHFHVVEAEKGGLSPAVIEAIRLGRRPEFENADETAVYAYARELLRNRRVSDETYQLALDTLGTVGIVELTALIGYYNMIAMTLNEHRVPLPTGATPALPEL